ncbi:SMP-30/gluconolactonase/LRE family protein [Methyloraptor flagellatus]|uniref:SMP-30/gluconolactonase/LRE family protein n=1 Tax=Methyloraptor flagellatus TaxID=3162530 RepID=A0AAU7XA71_9HYPH
MQTSPTAEEPAARLVVDARDGLGEGCFWDAETATLWWVDIAREGRLQCYVPATGAHRRFEGLHFPTAIAPRRDGGLIVATMDGLAVFEPDTAHYRIVAHPGPEPEDNRPNDGAADPRGRFFIGTMQQNIGPEGEDLPVSRDSGRLYRIESDLSFTAVAADIGISNSPIWSPDGKIFYFADTKAQVIYAYDYDAETGTIANRRVFSDETRYGFPDGSAMDAEGCLWNARWDAGVILRLAPSGEIDRVVKVPVARPTCCCFGGEEMTTLFVTSSRRGLSEDALAQQPDAGGVFALEVGVVGLPRNKFGG